MGYRSDFSGTIVATCHDPETARLVIMCVDDEATLDIADQMYVADGDTVMFVFDRCDTWYDAESAVATLVTWLRDQGIDAHGDIEVSGEETDDLWRIHVTKDSVVTQRGYVVYEDDAP